MKLGDLMANPEKPPWLEKADPSRPWAYYVYVPQPGGKAVRVWQYNFDIDVETMGAAAVREATAWIDSVDPQPREFELAITAWGKTRPVQFREIVHGTRAVSDYMFLGRFPKGDHVWLATMYLWKQPDGSWQPDFSMHVLNRSHARLFAWAEDYPQYAEEARKAGRVAY